MQPRRVLSATASRLDSSPTSPRAGASPLSLLSGSASCAWATLSLPAPPLLAVSVVSALEHSAQTSASAGRAPGSGSAGSRGGPTLTSEQALNRPKGTRHRRSPSGERALQLPHTLAGAVATCLVPSFLFLKAGRPGARKVTSRRGLVVTPCDRWCRASLHALIGAGRLSWRRPSALARPHCRRG